MQKNDGIKSQSEQYSVTNTSLSWITPLILDLNFSYIKWAKSVIFNVLKEKYSTEYQYIKKKNNGAPLLVDGEGTLSLILHLLTLSPIASSPETLIRELLEISLKTISLHDRFSTYSNPLIKWLVIRIK